MFLRCPVAFFFLSGSFLATYGHDPRSRPPYPLLNRDHNSSASGLLRASGAARPSRGFNSSQTSSSSATPNSKTFSQPSTITAAANASSTPAGGGVCLLGDPLCNSSGITATTDGPKIPGLGNGLPDQCILWNSTCTGNKTHALDVFFNTTGSYLLTENACFVEPQPACSRYESPAALKEFAEIKSWMRSPQCMSSSALWASRNGEPAMQTAQDLSCCNTCYLSGRSVDIYYWPEAGADTSCLSIVGEKVNAIDEGATTSVESGMVETTTYWGCTAASPVSGESIITTAEIRSIGSLTYKAPMVNPWSPPACIGVTTPSPHLPTTASATVSAQQPQVSFHARAHSLSINASITTNDGLPVSTLVSNGFTFTSPSVYANFHGIEANDWCGTSTVQQTMVSFAPGELSTIAGPLYSGISPGHDRPNLQTKAFNVADLPCPPQSVMEQNWYKPEPGEPYRPLIAIPEKVRAINPWFSSCTDLWFDAVDPPSALAPEGGLLPSPLAQNGPALKDPHNVLVDPTTSKQDPAPTNPPMPGSIVQPGPTLTALPDNILSSAPIAGGLPVQSSNAKSQQQENQPSGSGGPSQSQDGGGSIDNTGNEDVPSDPQSTESDDQNLPGFNPQDVPPAQMSQVKGALNTNAPAGPTHGPQPQDGGYLPSPPDDGNPQNPNTESIPMQIPGHAATVNPSGIIIDGSQIQPGDSPASVRGGVAINQGNSVVIGSQIAHLDSPPSPPVTNINGHVVQVLPSNVLVDNNLITPGGPPIKVSGTSVTLDGSSHLYLGGTRYQIPSATPAIKTNLPNGAVAVPVPDGVSLLGTTLTAGAPGITVSGTPISLDASNNLIFDGTAHLMPTAAGASWAPGQITTVNGLALTELPNGVCVSGTTIAPGAPFLDISGTSVSLAKYALVVGKTTMPITLPTEPPLVTTVGGQVVTAVPSAISIAGTTLLPGASAVTVSGTVISLNTAGALMVGSRTVPLPSASSGLGGLIMGGFGPYTTSPVAASSTSTTSPAAASSTSMTSLAAAVSTSSNSASATSSPSPQNTKSGIESVHNLLPLRWLAANLVAVAIACYM